MSLIFNLLENHQLKNKHNLCRLDDVRFGNPQKVGSYAVRNNCYQKRELVNNQDDHFYKYSLDKLQGKQTLDLAVNWQELFDKPEELLRLNSEIDSFLNYILSNRRIFLNTKNQPETESAAGLLADSDGAACATVLEERMSRLKIGRSVERSKRRLKFDFIVLRATLAILLNCQYNNRNYFTICAQKFDGTIYLSLQQDYRKEDIPDISKHALAAKKFEAYLTRNFTDREKLGERESVTYDDSAYWLNRQMEQDDLDMEDFVKKSKHNLCFVYSNRITHFKKPIITMAYAASMCCFENYFDLNKNPMNSDEINAVELKINREVPSNTSIEQNFLKTKVVKWWSQSVLSKCKKVVCGFWRDEKDDSFKLNEIKEYSLSELDRMGHFNSKLCFFQLYSTLEYIQKCFDINKDIELLEFVHERGSTKYECRPSTTRILPDYYCEEIFEDN